MGSLLINPSGRELWQDNAVFAGWNYSHDTFDVDGTLSIKTVVRGSGTWSTPESDYRVDEGSYLVLNEGQRYRLRFNSREPVHTFCVFFKPGFVGEALASVNLPLEAALETGALESPGFYERLHPHGDEVSASINALRSHLAKREPEALKETALLQEVALALVAAGGRAREQGGQLSGCKLSTREELYRRLSMGRDYILANLAADLDNDSIARAACLSPFYFNRLFKQAFGQSPHKFLTEQRLKRAANLLGKGGTIEEACLAAGFRSITTFCNLFSRTFGLTPGGWRAAQISQE